MKNGETFSYIAVELRGTDAIEIMTAYKPISRKLYDVP